MQAELEQVQAAFMKELKQVNEKLKSSENAVDELRQMRCNYFTFIHCVPKNDHIFIFVITRPNVNRF